MAAPSASAADAAAVDGAAPDSAPPAWSAVALALAMAAHGRLGAGAAEAMQAVAASSDLLIAVMRHIDVCVPDDAPTLASALRRAAPWQRIRLRRGQHLASAQLLGEPGSSQLRICRPVELCGEPGAVLRGTLVLEAGCAGGSLRDLRLEDGGDCCLRCEGGSWRLARLRLRCAHGSALFACGSSRLSLESCVLGGEGEEDVRAAVTLSAYGSVQEVGLLKRACFAIVAKDDADVSATGCALRQCSEAAVLVANRARALLDGCTIGGCTAALLAGQGRGRALELSGCVVEGSTQRLWFDADRPKAVVWRESRRLEPAGDAEPAEASIVPPAPRGAASDDDDDDESLEDPATFADMERLMEELDDIALSGAQAAVSGAISGGA